MNSTRFDEKKLITFFIRTIKYAIFELMGMGKKAADQKYGIERLVALLLISVEKTSSSEKSK